MQVQRTPVNEVVTFVPAAPDRNYFELLRRTLGSSGELRAQLRASRWELQVYGVIDPTCCTLQPNTLFDDTRGRTVRVHLGKEVLGKDPGAAQHAIPTGHMVLEPVAALYACIVVIQRGRYFGVRHIWTPGLSYSGTHAPTSAFCLSIDPPGIGQRRGLITLDYHECRARAHYGIGYGAFISTLS